MVSRPHVYIQGLRPSPADHCNPDSAIVIVQHFAAVSTSTAYSTSEVTVWACGSTITDCSEDSSTSLVSVVTDIVPVSTTICPLTVTSVTTSGVPGTNSGPLSTITFTVSSNSGTFYTIPASSAASNVSSVPGPTSASAPSSTAGSSMVTLHSTVTSMATITVPATIATASLGSVSSSLTGTLVVSFTAIHYSELKTDLTTERYRGFCRHAPSALLFRCGDHALLD